MNVRPLGGGFYNVESESSPGKFYKVEHQSKQASSFGVDYSCPCKAWINNVDGDRTCKHTRAVEVYKNGIINQLATKHRRIKAHSTTARRRGRPNYYEVEACSYCFKSSIKLKEEGVCKYCGRTRKEERTRTKDVINIHGFKSPRPIDNKTVSLGKDDFTKAAEKLGL